THGPAVRLSGDGDRLDSARHRATPADRNPPHFGEGQAAAVQLGAVAVLLVGEGVRAPRSWNRGSLLSPPPARGGRTPDRCGPGEPPHLAGHGCGGRRTLERRRVAPSTWLVAGSGWRLCSAPGATR